MPDHREILSLCRFFYLRCFMSNGSFIGLIFGIAVGIISYFFYEDHKSKNKKEKE